MKRFSQYTTAKNRTKGNKVKMTELKFKNLSFTDEKDRIKVTLLDYFYFHINKEELGKIGEFKVKKDLISFKDIKKEISERKFSFLVAKNISDLKSIVTGKPAAYIHKNSNIPLIGTNYFGIVDRNSSLIEIKPVTGCNLNCIYCSVNQDKRRTDFVIEKDYLVSELKKVISQKENNNIEIHIGTQGEPLFYSELTSLVKDIKGIKQVKTISIDTNGTLLSEKAIKELEEAGLTRINLSINSLDDKLAKKIAGANYSIKRIKEIAEFITKKTKIGLLIAPVMIPGINEQEMPKLAKFAIGIGAGKNAPPIGIQNFLNYRFGKNPAKEIPFEKFYEKLRQLEKEEDIRLIFNESDFNIVKTKELPKPFSKGDIIHANIVLNGRLKGEKLAAAAGRLISIPNCPDTKKGKIRLKIIRSKHNVFVGTLV